MKYIVLDNTCTCADDTIGLPLSNVFGSLMVFVICRKVILLQCLTVNLNLPFRGQNKVKVQMVIW